MKLYWLGKIVYFFMAFSVLFPLLRKISGEPCHLNCNTLEQTLNRLGLQQYLDVLQNENLDLESLVTHNIHTERTEGSIYGLHVVYCSHNNTHWVIWSYLENQLIFFFRLFAVTVILKIWEFLLDLERRSWIMSEGNGFQRSGSFQLCGFSSSFFLFFYLRICTWMKCNWRILVNFSDLHEFANLLSFFWFNIV